MTFVRGSNAHIERVVKNRETGLSASVTTLHALLKNFPDGPVILICDIEGTEVELIRHELKNFTRIELIIIETYPTFYDHGKQSNQKLIAALK